MRTEQDTSQACLDELLPGRRGLQKAPQLCPNQCFTQVGDLSDSHHSSHWAGSSKVRGTRTHFCALGSGGVGCCMEKVGRGQERQL